MGEIVDNCADVDGAEGLPHDFGAHRIEAGRRRCRRYCYRAAHGFCEAPECRLGKSQVVRAHQRVVVGNNERGQHDLGIAAKLYAAESPKYLRSQSSRMPRYDDDIFAAGIEVDTTDFRLNARNVGTIHVQSPPTDIRE